MQNLTHDSLALWDRLGRILMTWVMFGIFMIAFVLLLIVLLVCVFKHLGQEVRWLSGITDSLLLVNIAAIRANLFPNKSISLEESPVAPSGPSSRA